MDIRGSLHCFAVLLLCGLSFAWLAGREFAVSFMQNYIDKQHEAKRFLIEVFNPAPKMSAQVMVTALGKVHNKTVLPGKGELFQLPDEVEMLGTAKNKQTVRVEADQDIMVTSLNYKIFSTGASLIYPVKEWGTEYYVFTPRSPVSHKKIPNAYKEFSITNFKDKNVAEVYLKCAVKFQGKNYSKGEKLIIDLEPYESVQIQTEEENEQSGYNPNKGDLTGSKVVAKQPVAVFTGHSCTWMFAGCDHVYEQLLPVSKWGKEFIVVPITYQKPNGKYDSVYIQASQTTLIKVTGQDCAIMNKEMKTGETHDIHLNWPDSLYITANNGIQVLYEFNGGISSDNVLNDPFLINIMPTDHFDTSYTLITQIGFTNEALLVVRTEDLSGLQLGKAPSTKDFQWHKTGGGQYSWAEISYNDASGFFEVAHPESPFGLYSFGISRVNGYGTSAFSNMRGHRDCSRVTCPKGEQCQMMGGEARCLITTNPPPVIRSSGPVGTCWVMGDPHYRTFDGTYYNFMENCTYIMAKNCHTDTVHPAVEIQAENEHLGSTKAISVSKVIINVYDTTITIVRHETGLVRISDSLWYLPISLANGRVTLQQSGFSVVTETDFGLSVQYDWEQYMVVKVPASFMGRMCGMCGNFNGKKDDDLTIPSGSLAASIPALGKSWRVPGLPGEAYCTDDCTGQCNVCKGESWIEHLEAESFCQLVTLLTDGPLRDCKSLIDPKVFYENCLFDYCMGKGYKKFLCKTAQIYTDACQRAGIHVHDWRNLIGCPEPKCPANSHFDSCACPATCENPSPPADCKTKCVASCTCNDGFLWSGNTCVPKNQCGCIYSNGGQKRYLQAGESIWADATCSTKCTCNSGQVVCEKASCPDGSECSIVEGIRGCHPVSHAICNIYGDPHYNTFNNRTYNFQGTCTYTVAQSCHLEGTHLTPFAVIVENEKWTEIQVNPSVSAAKVNGILANIPVSLDDGKVKVQQEGVENVILTDFGLIVTYDMVYHVTITVPSSYHGKTCGLCGNFNGNKNDDFLLPDGKETKDVKTFGAAWKVPVPGVVCDDGCSGDVCPKCPENKKLVFEKDCSIIINPLGPFAACHNVINPESYFRDCVYDICMSDGDNNTICNSIAAYMTDCQNFGVTVKHWRTPTFCPLKCPANSHYEICAGSCDTPCPGLTELIKCNIQTCFEGCMCDAGFFNNGTGCVKADQCSCYENGLTYKIGESVITKNCQEHLSCLPSGEVKHATMNCKSNEVCRVEDGVRDCYPRQCMLETGGTFTLFSGESWIIRLIGAYELVKVCDDHLVFKWFRVVAQFQTRADGQSDVVAVHVFFKELAVTVTVGLGIWANGKKVVGVKTNGISVLSQDRAVVIETGSGLRVSYSSSQITVTVSEAMAGKLCGACGKLTGGESISITGESIKTYMNQYRAPDFPQCAS